MNKLQQLIDDNTWCLHPLGPVVWTINTRGVIRHYGTIVHEEPEPSHDTIQHRTDGE